MSATLVSHYGPKPDRLEAYILNLQEIIATTLSAAFIPYEIEQVHASIIGFEALRADYRTGTDVLVTSMPDNESVDVEAMLAFLRSPDIPSINIRIGGYSTSRDYGFQSRGQHPSIRSFSIQQEIAVAMGWPDDGSNRIDDFRRSFNQFNIRHKWHRSAKDVDNDFYFVLGKVRRERVSEEIITDLERKVKKYMGDSDPLYVQTSADTLAIVCYSNRELPRNSSMALTITDYSFTVEDFLTCIEDCSSSSPI